MARVLMPTMRRSYDHNPRGGSSTATVMMRADNPFERRAVLVPHRSDALPGMSGLGAEEAAAAPVAAPAPATGFSWGDIGSKLLSSVIDFGGALAAKEWLTPPPAPQLPAAGAQTLTAQGAQQLPSTQAAGMTAPGITPMGPGYAMIAPPTGGFARYMPWAVAGLGALVVGGVVMANRGGGRRSTSRRRSRRR